MCVSERMGVGGGCIGVPIEVRGFHYSTSPQKPLTGGGDTDIMCVYSVKQHFSDEYFGFKE